MKISGKQIGYVALGLVLGVAICYLLFRTPAGAHQSNGARPLDIIFTAKDMKSEGDASSDDRSSTADKASSHGQSPAGQ